jgi:hypothetical protein
LVFIIRTLRCDIDVVGGHESANHVVVRHLKFLFINTLQEFHLEVGDEARHSELANYFNKNLSYADALTTQKWEETERVSVFAAWSQEIRALKVKSIGNEFFRFLPLCGIGVESEDVKRNAVTFT